MVLDLVSNALASIVQLLVACIGYAIPVFVAVVVLRPVRLFLAKRMGWKWLFSAFATTYLTFLVLLILAVFVPAGLAIREATVGFAPEFLQDTLSEQAWAFASWIFRVLVLSALFSVLCLPLLFAGVFFNDWFANHVKNQWVVTAVSVYATVVVATIIAVFLVPWAIPGLLYLIYWA